MPWSYFLPYRTPSNLFLLLIRKAIVKTWPRTLASAPCLSQEHRVLWPLCSAPPNLGHLCPHYTPNSLPSLLSARIPHPHPTTHSLTPSMWLLSVPSHVFLSVLLTENCMPSVVPQNSTYYCPFWGERKKNLTVRTQLILSRVNLITWQVPPASIPSQVFVFAVARTHLIIVLNTCILLKLPF